MATRTSPRTYDFPTTELGMLREALAEQTAAGAPETLLSALREQIARRTGRTETTGPDAPERTSGTGRAPARDYSNQIKFFESLLDRKVAEADRDAYRARVGADPKVRSRVIDELLDLPDLVPDKQAQFIETLIVRKFAPEHRDAARATIPASRQARSQFIDLLIGLADAPTAAPARRAELAEGLYQRDGEIIRIKRARTSGYLYGAILDTETGRFHRANGVMKGLTAEHRLTADAAAAIGTAIGRCCQCGQELTNPESIERGIGPVCRGKV